MPVSTLPISTSSPLSALVDLERYPLQDDRAFAPIAARCRTQLNESSFASLPGFLRPGIAEAMTREVLDAVPRASAASGPSAPTMNRPRSSTRRTTSGDANTKAANSSSPPTFCPKRGN